MNSNSTREQQMNDEKKLSEKNLKFEQSNDNEFAMEENDRKVSENEENYKQMDPSMKTNVLDDHNDDETVDLTNVQHSMKENTETDSMKEDQHDVIKDDAKQIQRSSSDAISGNEETLASPKDTQPPKGSPTKIESEERIQQGLANLAKNEDEELDMIRKIIDAAEGDDATLLQDAQGKLLSSLNVDLVDEDFINQEESSPPPPPLDFAPPPPPSTDAIASPETSPKSNNGSNTGKSPVAMQESGINVIDSIIDTMKQTQIGENNSINEEDLIIEDDGALLSMIGSEKERQLLEQLVNQIRTEETTLQFAGLVGAVQFKSWCLACLRSRRYRLKRAISLLTNYAKWRQTFDPDMYDEEILRHHIKCDFISITNVQSESNVQGLLLIKLKNHDPKMYTHSQVVYLLHQVVQTAYKLKPTLQVLGFTVLLDLTGMRRAHYDRKLPENLFKMLNSRFPMRYTNLCIYNPPTTFSILLRIVSLFLTKKMKQRIHRIGQNKEAMLKYTSKDQLPKEYGGTFGGYDEEYFAEQTMAFVLDARAQRPKLRDRPVFWTEN